MFYLCPEKFCLPTTSSKSFADEYLFMDCWKTSKYELIPFTDFVRKRFALNVLKNNLNFNLLWCKSEMIFRSRVRWAESLVEVTRLWPASRVLVQIGSRTTRSCWAKHLHSYTVWWHNPCSPSTSAINLGSGCLVNVVQNGTHCCERVTEVRQPKWNKQIFANWTCSVPNVRCF